VSSKEYNKLKEGKEISAKKKVGKSVHPNSKELE